MDPWLESLWGGDFHSSLITYARDQLNEQLPPGLVARMENRTYIEGPIDIERSIVPDVQVSEEPTRPRTRPKPNGGTLTLAEPILIRKPKLEVRERYIEIRDAKTGGAIVTIVEIVSPSNKAAGDGRDKYVEKQREAVSASVNLVEIDLLRAGRSVTLAARDEAPKERRATYHACVSRASESDVVALYPLPLRDRLPGLSIPLRPQDEDVVLDLQSLLEQAYARGLYHETIDYARPPQPPLESADAVWARELVQAWGRSTNA